jgi:hypothetical protein
MVEELNIPACAMTLRTIDDSPICSGAFSGI